MSVCAVSQPLSVSNGSRESSANLREFQSSDTADKETGLKRKMVSNAAFHAITVSKLTPLVPSNVILIP